MFKRLLTHIRNALRNKTGGVCNDFPEIIKHTTIRCNETNITYRIKIDGVNYLVHSEHSGDFNIYKKLGDLMVHELESMDKVTDKCG